MRTPLLVLALAGALTACGGGGTDGLTLTPALGPPGTEVTYEPTCEEVVEGGAPLMSFYQGAEKVAGSLAVGPSTTIAVPEVAPGTYTVEISCGDPFGEGDVVDIGTAEFTVE